MSWKVTHSIWVPKNSRVHDFARVIDALTLIFFKAFHFFKITSTFSLQRYSSRLSIFAFTKKREEKNENIKEESIKLFNHIYHSIQFVSPEIMSSCWYPCSF